MPEGVSSSGRPAGTIDLHWVQHIDCTATIPLGLAREVFGLGGTPDDQLLVRIAALASRVPTLLQKLGGHAHELPIRWDLMSINGEPASEIFRAVPAT